MKRQWLKYFVSGALCLLFAEMALLFSFTQPTQLSLIGESWMIVGLWFLTVIVG